MTRRLISSGSPFEVAAGYSRAVADEDWCWIAGTTGYDYGAMRMPEGLDAQTRNAMETITSTLVEAGFALEDVVRATYYLTNEADVDTVFPILGSYFGTIRPAATMILCRLIKPEMKIEIEVTARKRS